MRTPAEGRPPALSPIWRQDGVFTVALTSFHDRAPARAAGFSWLAVQVWNAPWAGKNQADLIRLGGQLAAEGWKVGGWSTFGQGTDPAEDGRQAAALVERLGLLFWVANGELWAEGKDAWKSEAWIEGWEKGGAPPVPVATSCLSSDTGNFAREYDYEAWLELEGAAIQPQVYGVSAPGYTVEACRANMARAGVPEDRLAPTFEVVSPGGLGPFDDYRTWKGPRSVWTGEAATRVTWSSL